MPTAHVINLKRREDRRLAMQRACDVPGLSLSFVEAVDGREVDPEALIREGLAEATVRDFPSGSLGSCLSHKRQWEACIDSGAPRLVFEDDIEPREDFSEQYERVLATMPADWDYLALACNFNSVLQFELLPGLLFGGGFSDPYLADGHVAAFRGSRPPVARFRLHCAFGTSAYVVSPKGAVRLLEVCFPLARQVLRIPVLERDVATILIDFILNLHLPDLQAWCLVPPLAVTRHHPDDTDIYDARQGLADRLAGGA